METKKPGVRVVRLFLIVLGAAALGTLLYYTPKLFLRYYEEASAGELRSGGTSAAAFMVDKWRDVYNKERKIKLKYRSTGSSEGINGVIDRTFSIGFTHSPLSKEQKKKARENGGEMLHIPVAICAVVPIYNLKGLEYKPAVPIAGAGTVGLLASPLGQGPLLAPCAFLSGRADKPPLNFTREVLAGIFLGTIKKWSDPEIARINDHVKLPDTPITVVYRKDKSGTTFIFTEYMHGVNKEWDEKIKPAADVKWPVGEGMERSVNVIARVTQKDGAIGYADLVHANASQGVLSYGAVQNQEKTSFIHADPENMAAAAKAAEVSEELTFDLTNKSGKDAYPICGGIWAICYQTQPASDHKMVVDFLTWATHDGQQFAKQRAYAPVPDDIVKRIDGKLKSMKSS